MIDLDQHADIISTHILMNLAHDSDLDGLSLEDAYDLSDRVAARLEKPLGGFAGYKIAWNTPALMERFNMPHPGFGRVFNAEVRRGSADLQLSSYRNFMFEPEIIAILGHDIEPGGDYTPETVASAVQAFTVGFELLDRRDLPIESSTGPQILGHNVFNAGAIVGQERIPVDGLNVEEMTTRVQVNSDMLIEATAVAPQHPLEAIAFLAGHYCGRGHTMKAGQIILCGSHTPIQPVSEPTRVSAYMGRLGSVELNLR